VPLAVASPANRISIDDLFVRIGVLAIVWVIELLALSVWIDTESIAGRRGLLAAIGDWGPQVLSALVATTAATGVLAYVGAGSLLAGVSRNCGGAPIARTLLAAHAAAFVAWVLLTRALFAGTLGISDDLGAAAWLVAGLATAVVAAVAVIPARRWVELFAATKTVWTFAVLTALAAALLRRFAEELWEPASRATFALVSALVAPLVPGLTIDPANYTIESPAFGVAIAKECSGLEGAGLMLLFGGLWLAFFKREYRFPRALILLPAGLAIMWLTNIVRIAALFLIGNAGWGEVAAGGFHSQAGWIAFVTVALGLLVVSHRVAWLRSDQPVASAANPASAAGDVEAHLVPLLAIIAAGMLSGALSGTFEWLYPLRVLAALLAFWFFRGHYRSMDWRCDWVAVGAGVVVFAIWRVPDLFGAAHEAGMPQTLRSSGPAVTALWLLLRTVGGVITVPVAEELAFRGYLMRRLAAANFAQLPFARTPIWAVLVSSAIFGALHGGRFVEGLLAGIVYAWVIRRRGSIGDAAVAHGTTNGLIALGVLLNGEWRYW
jgi:exosortase E/protease (VPEID-CTERM system)